ncbi:10603_t:CDS:1 [Funneliformis geosporum]|nr:10603_t:CDS:1 [Funneliformis geosporum]
MREETSIILFGLTGQGKSSIANMLIKGDIKNDNSFNINDAVKGAGVQIQGYQNVNFIVYDTVGVGEPSTGTVPHMKAVKEIRNYFSKCEVPLNYIAFVKKKGRFTEEDRKMFNLFKEIFEGSENNFIIIITHSSKFWVDENIVDLRNNFGNYPIIPVDFPFEDPPEDDDDVIIHQRKRAQSLRRLTDKLSSLNRKEIKLQVLSSFQTAENKVAKVIDFIPIAGCAYQLISSGVYYKIGKSNLATERLVNGITGAAMDIAFVAAPIAVARGAKKCVGKTIIKGVVKTTELKITRNITKEIILKK